jgi:hypothetical protein
MEVRATLEDLMYVSILEKFVVLGVEMLPRLDGEYWGFSPPPAMTLAHDPCCTCFMAGNCVLGKGTGGSGFGLRPCLHRQQLCWHHHVHL